MQDLKLIQLRYFLTIVETGSFHQSAAQLGRTQPALSAGLRQLEGQIGGILLEKGGKTRLTALGRHFLPLARDLLARADETLTNIQALAGSSAGNITLAAVPSVADRVLPDLLHGFVTDHPGIQIRLVDDNSSHIQEMVRNRQVDIGIASMWQEASDLDYREILEDPIGLVCAADHPLARIGRPLTWKDLRNARMIRNGTSRLVTDPTIHQRIEDSDISVSNTSSLLALVRGDVGVTTLPKLAMPVPANGLAFREITRPRVTRSVGILTRSGESLLPAAANLIQRLVEENVPTDQPIPLG